MSTSDVPTSEASRKRGRDDDDEEDGGDVTRVKIEVAPETRYRGYNSHVADNLEPPYNRHERAHMPARCEARDREFSACIVQMGGEAFGTLDNGTSNFKFISEESFSLPTLGVRVKIPDNKRTTAGALPYDKQSIPSHTIEWDLNQLSAADVTVFRLEKSEPLEEELRLLVNEMRLDDEDAFNADYKRGAATRMNFARIRISRHVDDEKRANDFSHWEDTQAIEWCPDEIKEHSFNRPFYPEMPDFDFVEQRAIKLLKAAQQVTFWVAITNRQAEGRYFDNYARLINTLIRQGNNSKPCTDTWFSLHPRYRGRDKRTKEGNVKSPWQDFLSEKFALDQKSRPWPERQPWLQVEGQDRWIPVTDPDKPRTRFPSLVAYEQTMTAACLFELEHITMMYEDQYNEQNHYIATFTSKGDGYFLVRIRTHGDGLVTSHGKEQIKLPPNTVVDVRVATDKEDAEGVWHTNWSGRIAEVKEEGVDFVFSAAMPPKYEHEALSGEQLVVIKPRITDYQTDLQLQAISGACTMARQKPKVDSRGRRFFHLKNLMCGDRVHELSPDFLQDWEDWAKQPRTDYDDDDDALPVDPARLNVAPEDRQAIRDEIVEIPRRLGLNNEQRQAYWLFLKGLRAGWLAIEGFPGTGKSETIMAIIVALMALEVRILLCAQSNTGVTSVFTKVTEHLAVWHPDWLETKVVRLGANSIEDGLSLQLDKIAFNVDINEEILALETSMPAEILPYTVAVKTAKWMRDHPDDELTRSNDLWKAAKARAEARVSGGKIRKPRGVEKSRSQTKNLLFKKAVKPNQVLLIGATAAAAAKLSEDLNWQADAVIFDELSQCDEGTFMIPLKDQWRFKALAGGGDRKQLGPVIQGKTTSPYAPFRASSPLSRLLDAYRDRPLCTLWRNYRSHPEIVNVASKIVYGGKMKSGHAQWPDDSALANQVIEGALKRDLATTFGFALRYSNVRKANGQCRLWFLDTKNGFSLKAENGTSSWNKGGSSCTVQLARALVKYIGNQERVKIITMYKYEVVQIKAALSKLGLDKVYVRTVDSFQGDQESIVLVHFSAAHMVDDHPLSDGISGVNPMGFVSNLERMNVAITRAKNFCFLVGNVDWWLDRMHEYKTKPSLDDLPKDRYGRDRIPVRENANPLLWLVKEVKALGQCIEWKEPYEDFWAGDDDLPLEFDDLCFD